ncbi:MAG TPA: DUF2268 domain-containing putative Zn-dependent protease [Chitinophagaceae bacterium]|nr:DUF2268 domain-containing putative Zn-dependent protease [Chitinophagaceae bacterium]
MKRIFATFSLLCILSFTSKGQDTKKVFTSDIDNFWTAYDSIQTTKDSLKQIAFIKRLYIDKGTKGLKAFMAVRNYDAKLWVQLIRMYPKFWSSIRPNTLTSKSYAPEIEKSINKFKELYPDLKEAKMYFTVGGLRSGGTTMNDMVLIGSEIATGNALTDVSEFPNKWLEGVFKNQQADNIVPLNIHEYVHTQQIGNPQNLLGQAIKEGACDFITELVIGKLMQNNYIVYGREHDAELKEQFKFEMFTTAYTNWLYNGSTSKTVADLGYYMGYTICKSYYNNSTDKKKAIKEIIELNYSDSTAVEDFLKRSNYYTEPINKAELRQAFESKRPSVIRLEPFANGDSLVDAGIKELKIVFSSSMDKKGYSINDGKRGKDYSPISGVVGFSDDGTSFTLKIDMKPNHEYEFIITDKSFRSKDGYSLKPYEVKFKTK